MKVIISLVIFLFMFGDAEAQRFSKEFFTINFLDESVVFMASIDYTTKRHFAREFILGNVLSFSNVKPRTNRIILYTFMSAFELGQGRVDLFDLLAGAGGIELNLFIRRIWR